MKKTTILWLLFSLMGIIALPASAQCTAENNAFSAGEDLSYKLYFNWKFIWVTVGTANMSIKKHKLPRPRSLSLPSHHKR